MTRFAPIPFNSETIGGCTRVDLFAALRSLDLRLTKAIEAAENTYGVPFQDGQFRGLHLSEGDIACLLARDPGCSPLGQEDFNDLLAEGPATFISLASIFGLQKFELGLLLICLAPEVDLRYERLYAYLQDDVTRKKPSVDLVLNLLTASPEERLAARRSFIASAPLLKYRLVSLADEPGYSNSPLLAKTIKLDPRIVEYLLGSDALPVELLDYVQLTIPARKPEQIVLAEDTKRTLLEILSSKTTDFNRHSLYFEGPCGVGRQAVAEMLCTRLGKRLLCADLSRLLLLDDHPFDETLRRIVREAALQNAALYLRNFDLLLVDGMTRRLMTSVEILTSAGLTFLSGNTPWEPADIFPDRLFFRMVMERPGFDSRLQLWKRELKTMPTVDVEKVAAKFKFTGGQIRDAAITAERLSRWRNPDHPQITAGDLFEACRRQSNQKLSRLAQKIVPRCAWDDIVLPDDQVAQFREICNQSIYRPLVLEDWGFENKLSYGKGLNVLFSGPPGTGKTMAAEVIANELMLDLYRIDLSQVVSKYIGETEKNLDRIFTEAQTSNAILLFDEADALFGKRSEVKDAHDRYANIETGYLLQKMEEYDGIAILATNLRGNMDEAFVRRMSFCVEFPFPKEQERRLIWDKIWPATTPRRPGLQLDRMAKEFEISGGSIKNIALAAAFMAADDGGVIDLCHLMRATRREYQKMGKVMMGGEFDEHEQRPFSSAS